VVHDVAVFERYAWRLAYKYPFAGSGADEEDVAQEARIAAWEAIGEYTQGLMSFEGFVMRRMELRVIDFVRLRQAGGQRRFERDTSVLGDRDVPGRDVTCATVIARDELQRAVRAVNDLPPSQQRYLKGRISGLCSREIEPGRRRTSVDASVFKARRRVALALAA
jgi:DNA-directed RNA polymerase specialized sigma24 family protein